jgi:hypothetical protein
MRIKIYSRLSVGDEAIKKILPDAEVCGPIKRSDLLADIAERVNIVGIIDGEFQQSFAVSPTNIRDALRHGLKIYGSSSMGAMRAAELDCCGMIGCGKIYETIKATPYFKDDHLGQVFNPGTYASHVAFVDLALGLEQLYRDGSVTSKDMRTLRRHYEALHFSERSMAELKARLRKPGPQQARLLRVLDTVSRRIRSTKTLDGITLLKRIKSDVLRTQRVNQALDARV